MAKRTKKATRAGARQGPARPRRRTADRAPAQARASTGSDALMISRERLRLVAGFSGMIVGDEPLVEQARAMAEQARATFGADACIVRLLEGEDLVLLAAVGVPAKSRHPRIPIGWGISKRILSHRRPIFIKDVSKNPAMLAVRNRLPDSYEFTSYAGTPLIAKDRVIGIFGLYTIGRMAEFTEDDLNLLQIFGNNMSAAILNERLYEEATLQRDLLKAEILERHRAERALRESEERYRRIVEDLPEFVARWLPDGTRTFVNESYCRYLGRSADQLVGQSFFPMLPDSERESLLRYIAQATPDSPAYTGEYHTPLPGGRTGCVEWSARALFDEDGKLRELQSIGRDITERKRLQEQSLQVRKMESIGTLAGGIAHDFGNVLAVILGNVSVLQRQPGLAQKVRDLLTDVAAAAERGSAFTQQLLAYAHGVARQPSVVQLNDVVQTVCDMLERVKPHGIDFILELDESLPDVTADRVQMEQVMMNLGLNAVQASSAPAEVEIATGSRRLGAEEAARLELVQGLYVFLRVRDQGTGISSQNRERMFEPFFTTKPMGRGMGLATTRAIVDDHHGRIEIQSAPGKGTCVTVWLPAMKHADRGTRDAE